MSNISIFVSYAHEDDHWVTDEGKKGLITWLRQRLKNDQVVFWSDLSIRGGDKWDKKISDQIASSQIALLLISEDFATSDFIMKKELPQIKKRNEAGDMLVIPILVGGISTRTRNDLQWVLGFQVVPNDQKSLNDYTRHEADWDQVRAQILDEIDHSVQRLRTVATEPVAPVSRQIPQTEQIKASAPTVISKSPAAPSGLPIGTTIEQPAPRPKTLRIKRPGGEDEEAELARQAAERRERELAAEAAAQAARAKAEQEALVRPSIKFVAVLDEREVRGAKVSYGTDTWATPIVLNLTKGGSYLFKLSHTDASGREYVGESQFTATWTGEQIQRIALAPKGPPAPAAGFSPQNDALSLDLGGGVALECVLIRPGVFIMGDKSETPAHKVRLTKPFYMGKFAVTQEQWEKVMGANPSLFKGAKLPVERVSWDDCQSFLTKLKAKVPGTDFSLPTEAQWEYACRAGTTTEYCFGDAEAALGDHAWYDGNSESKTHEVGKKKPNAWGLFDMHGNVWEWCSDWYGAYTAAEAVDPSGPSSGSSRVLRGGSWFFYASFCRSAFRF